MFLTTDNGINWIHKSKGIDTRVHTLYFIGDFIFILGWDVNLSCSSLFGSSDGGDNWYGINSFIHPYVGIITLYINEDYIYAGTSDGIYRAKLSDLGVSVVDTPTPDETSFSIAPNPSFDYIEISGFGTKTKSNIEDNNVINIYNVLGDKVLNVGFQNFNSQRIDISTLIPGLYYCSVRIGGNNLTKRFMVIK
jgi:hypothetical protein